MKFTAPTNSAKMEERSREVLFGRPGCAFIGAPIGTHLFLLIAKLRDGATVNMTDGCDDGISAPSEQTRATDEPRKSLATRRLDLEGAECREGSLESERGWCSTANRYT